MKVAVITLVLGIATCIAKDPAAPQYDPKTETTVTGTIVNVYEFHGALEGVAVKLETKAETFDVYIAPASFVKMVDIPLKNGLTLEVTASLVTVESSKVMLARDLKIGKNIYSVRDRNGVPNWLWMTRTAPTGL